MENDKIIEIEKSWRITPYGVAQLLKKIRPSKITGVKEEGAAPNDNEPSLIFSKTVKIEQTWLTSTPAINENIKQLKTRLRKETLLVSAKNDAPLKKSKFYFDTKIDFSTAIFEKFFSKRGYKERFEVRKEINEKSYNFLLMMTSGETTITKTRIYFYDRNDVYSTDGTSSHFRKYGLDIYPEGDGKGNLEVEFDNTEEAQRYVTPNWITAISENKETE